MTQQLKGEKYEYPSYNWALGLPPPQVPQKGPTSFTSSGDEI
jgi:hypothetical protein